MELQDDIFTIILLILTFAFLGYSQIVNAQTLEELEFSSANSDTVYVFYEGNCVLEISKEDFKNMVQDSIIYNELRIAEEEENYRIIILKPDEEEPEIKVEWFKGDEIIRTVTAKVKLNTDASIYEQWGEVYSDIAEVAFPVTTIVLIIVFIIVL